MAPEVERADFPRGGCVSTLLPVFRNQNGKQRSAALRCPTALCPLWQVAERPWTGTSNFPDSEVDTSASREPAWSLNRSRKLPLNYRSGSVAEWPEILLKNSMHIRCYPKRLTSSRLTATSRAGGLMARGGAHTHSQQLPVAPAASLSVTTSGTSLCTVRKYIHLS